MSGNHHQLMRGSREEWEQIQKAAEAATTPQHEMRCMADTTAILNQVVGMRSRIEDISGVIVSLGAALNGKHRMGKPECPENKPMVEGAIPQIRRKLDALQQAIESLADAVTEVL